MTGKNEDGFAGANHVDLRKMPPSSGVLEVDLELCHQCGICELSCSLYHEGVCSPSFSRISLLRNPFTGDGLVETCRQCAYPDCYFVCPVGAIIIDEKTGARVIVEENCIACGKCDQACPFNSSKTIIKYNKEKEVYFKCHLCYGRETGPVCVEACPWSALKFIPRKKGQMEVEEK